jgi:uncharacterized protein (TIGR03067 family)
MTRPAWIALASLTASVAVAAPVPKSAKNQNRDKAELVGEWLEPADKARVWWFKEDGTAGGGDLKNPSRRGVYRIDPTASPKTLDWSDDEGQTWQLGVFGIENGVLTVNIAAGSKDPRPTSFDETAKSHKITATRKKE